MKHRTYKYAHVFFFRLHALWMVPAALCIAAIGAPNDDIDGMDTAGIASPLSKSDFFPPGLFSPASGPRTSPPPDDVGAREGCVGAARRFAKPPVSAGSADAVSSDTVFASRATRRSRASLACSSLLGSGDGSAYRSYGSRGRWPRRAEGGGDASETPLENRTPLAD